MFKEPNLTFGTVIGILNRLKYEELIAVAPKIALLIKISDPLSFEKFNESELRKLFKKFARTLKNNNTKLKAVEDVLGNFLREKLKNKFHKT